MFCLPSDLEDRDSFETRNGQPAIFTDCTRKCDAGAPKRICYYKWVLELYNVMGTACGNCSKGVMRDCDRPQCVPGDGVERSCLTINRQMDGPPIDVCQGDLVVVDVSNMMEGIEETIHWHGILQKGFQFMDGVPMLTQCPIAYLNIFRYNVQSARVWHFLLPFTFRYSLWY
ncbi:unnamed protein product, partial [Timema podura]|nr:unnamed protein product [Timema podura]